MLLQDFKNRKQSSRLWVPRRFGFQLAFVNWKSYGFRLLGLLATLAVLMVGVNLIHDIIRGVPAARHTAQVEQHSTTVALALPETAPEEAELEVAAEPEETKVQALPTQRWQTVHVRPGDSLARIFKRLNYSARTLHQIIALGKLTKPLKKLQPKQVIRFLSDDEHHLQQLAYKIGATKTLVVNRNPAGFKAKIEEHDLESREVAISGVIKQSLFVAAQKAGLPQKIIMELADVFAWDLDFAQDIRPGDSFRIIYEDDYLGEKKVRTGDILAAEFNNRGKTYRAVRYTDPKGRTSYYTPNGLNVKRKFLRTPVKFTRISSRFNLHRRHPVLHTIRAHKGVDYAAPKGTPIKSTGNGKIIFRGRKGGYGNVVIVDHGRGYSTLYAHMSRFARNEGRGSRVKQGQIIGYVGQSGLATGPHLHYEFRINGTHRNPLTVRLPFASPIARSYKQEYTRYAKNLLTRLDGEKT